MSKNTRNLIIGIGLASILFSVYGMLRGDTFMDALSGIVIGVSLIGTLFIDSKNEKK